MLYCFGGVAGHGDLDLRRFRRGSLLEMASYLSVEELLVVLLEVLKKLVIFVICEVALPRRDLR